MPKKIAPTVSELKTILFAAFTSQHEKMMDARTGFYKGLGGKTEEVTAKERASIDDIHNLLADIVARRLKRNRQTVPLFTSREYIRFAPILLRIMGVKNINKLGVAEKRGIEMATRIGFEAIVELFEYMVPENNNLYPEYWRLINTILNLANKEGISPKKFLALEWANDEIMRQMFSAEEFMIFYKRKFQRFTDKEVIKKACLEPVLNLASNEEERHEIEQNIDPDFINQIETLAELSNVYYNSYINEEFKRIYKSS